MSPPAVVNSPFFGSSSQLRESAYHSKMERKTRPPFHDGQAGTAGGGQSEAGQNARGCVMLYASTASACVWEAGCGGNARHCVWSPDTTRNLVHLRSRTQLKRTFLRVVASTTRNLVHLRSRTQLKRTLLRVVASTTRNLVHFVDRAPTKRTPLRVVDRYCTQRRAFAPHHRNKMHARAWYRS